jgi:hypothetical protein
VKRQNIAIEKWSEISHKFPAGAKLRVHSSGASLNAHFENISVSLIHPFV